MSQGDPTEWVSSHRYHHQHCDTEKDPHTPYEGFWHSHMGWLLDDSKTQERVSERRLLWFSGIFNNFAVDSGESEELVELIPRYYRYWSKCL